IVDRAAVERVANTDLDLVKPIENVELGQSEAVNAAGPHCLAYQHRVEPAATPRSSCDHAEFLAPLAKHFANVVELFGRKRTGADARRIGLADAEHIADRARAQPRSCRR